VYLLISPLIKCFSNYNFFSLYLAFKNLKKQKYSNMKKITLTILAAVGSIAAAYSQASISIRVPNKTNSYIDVLPGGTVNSAEYTGIFLYSATELGALTGINVTGIGLAL